MTKCEYINTTVWMLASSKLMLRSQGLMWWYQGCGLWYDPVMRAAAGGCGADLVAQLYPNLCNLIDCSPPGFSVHGISQARILEWVAIFFSRGSSRPRNQNHISCTGNQILYHWATREAPRGLRSHSWDQNPDKRGPRVLPHPFHHEMTWGKTAVYTPI